MTKFITYFNVCPIPEHKNFLGLSPDKEQGNIITTLDKNITLVIKISTQKQIRSWTFLEKFSTKVVYDKKSDKYVGVFASTMIRCWDEHVTDISKCKKYKFQRAIADLISNDEETIVLYSDGTFETLQAAINNRKEIIISQPFEYASNIQFTNAAVHVLKNGSRIITYFEYNKADNERHLICAPLENQNNIQQVRRFKLKRADLDVFIVGFAVIEGSDTPVLVTIWSDNRIFLLTLTDDVSPEASPGKFASILTQLKTDSPLSIVGISGHFIAIYGANNGQDGASLLLYNTQYKVIKATQYFKVYFDYSKLWTINDYIMLAMGQNLSAVQYRLLKEILSELIGTQVNNSCALLADNPINEEELLEDYLQYSESCTSNVANKFEDNYKIHKIKPAKSTFIADGKTIPFKSSSQFHKKLNELSQMDLHVQVVQTDEPLDEARITVMNNYQDNGFATTEIQTIAMQLEEMGASEQEITEKLLKVLIQSDLIEDVEACLKRYTNISERMLSKTLQYVLKYFTDEQQTNDNPNDDNKNVNESTNQKDDDNSGHESTNNDMKVDVELVKDNSKETAKTMDTLSCARPKLSVMQIERVLNTLLSCSVNPTTIAFYVRQDIEYSEVFVMLKHLYKMLTDEDVIDFNERPLSGDNNYSISINFEMQLLRWFGILLDAHFQKLVLSRDSKLLDLLLKWQELFAQYKKTFKELSELSAQLYYIVHRKVKIQQKLDPCNCNAL